MARTKQTARRDLYNKAFRKAPPTIARRKTANYRAPSPDDLEDDESEATPCGCCNPETGSPLLDPDEVEVSFPFLVSFLGLTLTWDYKLTLLARTRISRRRG